MHLPKSSALKFDLSGVERRSKHDMFKGRNQLGKFHHLNTERRKDPTVCKTVCNTEVSPTCCTFRASLVHWKSATFLMNEIHW